MTHGYSEMKPKITNIQMGSVDDENDMIREWVDKWLPRPVGGFETDEQEGEWREAGEAAFKLFCRNKGVPFYDWPEWEFHHGGDLDTLLRYLRFDVSPRDVVNQRNAWDLTLESFLRC